MHRILRAIDVLNSAYPGSRWHFATKPVLIKLNTYLPRGLWKEPSSEHDNNMNRAYSVPLHLEKLGFSTHEVQQIMKSIQTQEAERPFLKPYLYISEDRDSHAIDILGKNCECHILVKKSC